MRTHLQESFIQSNKFDFLDFGAYSGDSLEYGEVHFFGERGLGIDLDPKRVAIMKKAGYDCVVGDLTKIIIPKKCVRFVKMAHILEHMPDYKAIERVVGLAEKSATNFLVITGPYFDEDKYLASKGFKLHWSDYPDHPYHLMVSELVHILNKLKLDNYEIYLRFPILNSSNQHIHPLNSPSHSHLYNPKIHPPKRHVSFNKDIWTDFVCYVQLKETKNWDQITKAYKNQIPYMEVKDGVKYIWPRRAVKKYVAMDAENQAMGEKVRGLQARTSTLQQQLLAIKNSKSWRTARFLQKISFLIRHPRLSVKKIKTKFTL